MSRYCVDFQSGSDWYSPQGSYETMLDSVFTCNRGWVVIQSHEFAQLEPSTQTPQQPTGNPLIEPLTLMFGALMVAMAAVWGVKRVYRLLITGGHHGD